MKHAKVRFSGRSLDEGDSLLPARPRLGRAVSQSPLQEAVLRGCPDDVQQLLNSASAGDVNAKDSAGRTLLMLAVEADSPETIGVLLRHGAEPNEGNAFGTSPLYQAVSARRHRCAERLLLGGALVNAHSLRQRHAPLHAAAAGGDAPCTALLLSFGADANVLDYRHRTPLHAAAAGGFADVVTLLLGSGARVDVRDLRELTPLGLARDAACRGALLEADAALSAADLRRLLRESPSAVQELLDGGVKPGEGGVLLVSYKPFRDVGGTSRPFEAELVTELQRSGRWDLLGHPAVELLLELTRQDGYFVFHTAAKILWCIIFLAALIGTLAVDLYGVGRDVRGMETGMKATLIFLNCLQLAFLLVKMLVVGKGFFLSGRRWPVLVKTALIFVVFCLRGEPEKRLVYAFAVLMAFFEFTMALESISVWKTTRAISSLLHVTRSIAEYLLVYLPVLVGFSVAFFIMFGSGDADEADGNLFHGRVLAINMAAMILGEMDVMEAEKHTPKSNLGYVMSTTVFLMFVVLVPIVMLNLLLALTISDTTKFLSKGGAEFLRNLANRTAWNQQAAFMADDWVHKLKPMLPRSVFDYIARYSLQFKWQSVLPRPAASVRATPRVTVDPFARGGKRVRAIVAGSSRQFRVRPALRQSLDAIVEAQRTAEAAAPPPAQIDADDEDTGAHPACCGSSGAAGSCEHLGHSVSNIATSTLRFKRDTWSQSERRPLSVQRRRPDAARRCCSVPAPSDQLAAIHEMLDRQQDMQERMMQRLLTMESTLTRLTGDLPPPDAGAGPAGTAVARNQ